MAFELPDLPYPYEALEPYMSAETLHYHHDKHHKAYVDNLNRLIKGTEFEGMELQEIIKKSFGKNAGVFNNAAQDFNHIEFWPWMKKGGGGKKVPGAVLALIDRDLGGYDKFREAFIEAGKTQFGSGWAWLALNKDGKLEVTKTPNGENPLVHGGWPLLGVDVSGTFLLHRLQERAAEISRSVVRPSHQLGPRRGDVRPGAERVAVIPDQVWFRGAGLRSRANCSPRDRGPSWRCRAPRRRD